MRAMVAEGKGSDPLSLPDSRGLTPVGRPECVLGGWPSGRLRASPYSPGVDRDTAKTRGLGLAWAGVLAAAVILWLAAPDIRVSETLGNGCGRWNSAELSEHREQLVLFLLVPLLVAQSIAPAWVALRREDVKKFALLVAGGLAWVLLLLWQPANTAYV
jgi:hypothetical protein